MERHPRGHDLAGLDREVLQLVRRALAALRQATERDLVVERADHQLRHRARGRLRRGIEAAHAEAQRVRREREHATELSAAEDRDLHG